MRIIRDTAPRYRIQGVSSLADLSFSSEEDAIRALQIYYITYILRPAKIDYSVPNPVYAVAEAIVDRFGPLASKRQLSRLK